MKTNEPDFKLVQLVTNAREGHQESLDKLAEMAQGRLLSYIYRLTLDYELSHDLCQETLVKMVEHLPHLRQADRFWFWLFRTAMGQVQHHYRNQRKEEKVRIAALNKRQWEQELGQAHDFGMDRTARIELTEIVVETIMGMRLSYRNVLVLRCFDQMSYAQIAEFMGCKELHARVLFYRAKRILRQHLSRRGITRTALGAGLYLFGLLTAHSKGVTATISASTLDVGYTASLVGLLGTKFGIAVVSLAGALAVGITPQRILISLVIFSALIVVAGFLNLWMEN